MVPAVGVCRRDCDHAGIGLARANRASSDGVARPSGDDAVGSSRGVVVVPASWLCRAGSQSVGARSLECAASSYMAGVLAAMAGGVPFAAPEMVEPVPL